MNVSENAGTVRAPGSVVETSQYDFRWPSVNDKKIGCAGFWLADYFGLCTVHSINHTISLCWKLTSTRSIVRGIISVAIGSSTSKRASEPQYIHIGDHI